MTETIHFPHLNIHLEHVGKSISIFGFDIAYYGIIIGIGIMAGLALALHEAKRTKQNTEIYYDLVIYGFICSIIGARAYYVIFSWDNYKDNLLRIFNLREGGLAIYGGVIGAVLTMFVYARIKKESFGIILDTVAPALILGQCIGRWGNFFNREAFGEYTNQLFAMQLPADAVRWSDITEKMLENLEVIDGISYIQVHPTFLYESLWNLGVLIFLLIWRKYKKFNGEIFLCYLFGYGIGRFWIEGLRTDQLLLPKIHYPVSRLLAAVLVIVSITIIIIKRRKIKKIEKQSSI